LWDPLWEYVLEDYDDDEKARRRNRSQRSSGGGSTSSKYAKAEQKKKNDDSGLLNMNFNFFDMSSSNDDKTNKRVVNTRDDSEQDNAWKVDWFDGRDDREEASTKKPIKGILRKSDSKLSIGGQSTSNLKSISDSNNSSRSFRGSSSRSNSRILEEDDEYEDYTKLILLSDSTASKKKGRPSSRKKRASEKNRKLGSKDSKPVVSFKLDSEDTDDEGNSTDFGEVWDAIVGNPPATTIKTEASSKTRNQTDVSSSKSYAERSTPSKSRPFPFSLRKSNSETSSLALKETNSKDESVGKKSKRAGLFRRRSKKSNNSFSKNLNDDKDDLGGNSDVKDLSANDSRGVKEDRDRSDDYPLAGFDPMALLFEVAGRLDPWGLDSGADSNSETSASDTRSVNDDSTTEVANMEVRTSSRPRSGKIETAESHLVQPLPNPDNFDPRYTYHPHQPRATEPTRATEIRLKVNTVGDTLSEEVYERTLNITDNEESEFDAENSQLWEDAPSNVQSPSVADASSSKNSTIDMSEPNPSLEDFSEKSEIIVINKPPAEERSVTNGPSVPKSQEGLGPSKTDFPSEEMQVPLDLHITKEDDRPFFTDQDIEDAALSSSQSRGIWKVVCCNAGKKLNNSGDLVSQLRKEDAAEVFPTTRMIANGQSHFITGEKADLVNGVMGVPSDRFLDAKGPQSLYAYDYDSNEHMVVQYSENGPKSRKTISVKSLGSPPSLSASSGRENVVIQVEVRIIVSCLCNNRTLAETM
jgi:hypothetical protein